MADEKRVISLDEFFSGPRKPLVRIVEMRDGSRVKITLTPPHASDAGRASRIIKGISPESNIEASRNSLTILACCSCIEEVNHDNVMEFLSHFRTPQGEAVVAECLKLLGIGDDYLKKLGFNVNPGPVKELEYIGN